MDDAEQHAPGSKTPFLSVETRRHDDDDDDDDGAAHYAGGGAAHRGGGTAQTRNGSAYDFAGVASLPPPVSRVALCLRTRSGRPLTVVVASLTLLALLAATAIYLFTGTARETPERAAALPPSSPFHKRPSPANVYGLSSVAPNVAGVPVVTDADIADVVGDVASGDVNGTAAADSNASAAHDLTHARSRGYFGAFLGVQVSNFTNGTVLLEVPVAELERPFVIDAIYTRGDAEALLLHMPSNMLERNWFAFRVSSPRPSNQLDIYRPQLDVRMSGHDMGDPNWTKTPPASSSSYSSASNSSVTSSSSSSPPFSPSPPLSPTPATGLSLSYERGMWTGWVTTVDIVGVREHSNATDGKGPALIVDIGSWARSGFSVFERSARAQHQSDADASKDDFTWKARVTRARAFPRNLQVVVQAMVSGIDRKSEVDPQSAYAAELTFNLAALPREPMRPRRADNRIGYFTTSYRTLDDAGAFRSRVDLINRRRLPTARNAPITYYIDPTVPHRWRPYVKRGVENWRKAFRAAGFDGHAAIRAVLPGERDWPADYDASDMRYSSISWAPALRSVYALGPSHVDPRTGEILNAAIVFTHGWLRSWLRQYALIVRAANSGSTARAASLTAPAELRPVHCVGAAAAGGVDECATGALLAPGALLDGGRYANDEGEPDLTGSTAPTASMRRSPARVFVHGSRVDALSAHLLRGAALATDLGEVPEEFVGAALTDTVMHEVGHTLGLRHNFHGSANVPWDKLRDPAYVKKHGTLTSSVMDYCPVFVLANSSEQSLYFSSAVGEYDVAAIQYGYSLFDGDGGKGGGDGDGGARRHAANTVSRAPLDSTVPSAAAPTVWLDESNAVRRRLDDVARRTVDNGLHFGTDEDDPSPSGANVYVSTWDMSSEPLRYHHNVVSLLDRIMARTDELTTQRHLAWTDHAHFVNTSIRMARRTALFAAKYAGGVAVDRHRPRSAHDTARRPIDADQVRQAVRLILRTVSPLHSEALFGAGKASGWMRRLVVESGECSGVATYCMGVAPVNVLATLRDARQDVLDALLSPARISRVRDAAATIAVSGGDGSGERDSDSSRNVVDGGDSAWSSRGIADSDAHRATQPDGGDGDDRDTDDNTDALSATEYLRLLTSGFFGNTGAPDTDGDSDAGSGDNARTLVAPERAFVYDAQAQYVGSLVALANDSVFRADEPVGYAAVAYELRRLHCRVLRALRAADGARNKAASKRRRGASGAPAVAAYDEEIAHLLGVNARLAERYPPLDKGGVYDAATVSCV